MEHSERRELARKMAKACIDCMTNAEFDALSKWSEDNLTTDIVYALEDAISLVIAF